MTVPTKVPPRFVPTLTEVVGNAAQADVAPAKQAASWLPRAAVVAQKPPSAANRLWVSGESAQQAGAEISPVHAEPVVPPAPTAPSTPALTGDAARAVLSTDFEELLVHRVMQRVDISLDVQISGAIAAVVQEQTRSIVPRLREEIEAVVRQAVYEAVADELAAGLDRPAV
ncbi:MAG: hypothetical protein ACTS8S_01745 [Giesbergeria sp.]